MCLTYAEIRRRMAEGVETPAQIDLRGWQRRLKVVQNNDSIHSTYELEMRIEYGLACALCEYYDHCKECPFYKVNDNKPCDKKGNAYHTYANYSMCRSSLLQTIILVLQMLDAAAALEKLTWKKQEVQDAN